MATYLVRHGESEGNCHKGYYGSLDTPLTEQGMAQGREAAHELSERMKEKSVHEVAIFTSPLQRAFRTASILEENLELPCRIEVVPYLTEIDFGRWEGMDYEEIKEKYPEECLEWQEDWVNFQFPQGESFKKFYQRVEWCWKGLERKIDAFDGDSVVVSHGGVLKVIKLINENRPVDDFWKLKFSLGEVQVVKWGIYFERKLQYIFSNHIE